MWRSRSTIPEEGTDLERVAMQFHAQALPQHLASRTAPPANCNAQETSAATSPTASPPVVGAPYADPCIDDKGKSFTGKGSFFSGSAGRLLHRHRTGAQCQQSPHLQGRGDPARRGAEQGGLPLSAAAHSHPVAGRGADAQPGPGSGTAGDADEYLRMRRVLAHQPGSRGL